MAIAGLYPFTAKWHEQGTLWLTSDTHFGDKGLSSGISGRPSDEELVKLINAKVGRKDTLIHLGDVGDIKYVRKLRGYKILIMGNHDAGSTNYKRVRIARRFDTENWTRDMVIFTMAHDYPDWKLTIQEGYDHYAPFTFYEVVADNCLFDEVYEGPLTIGNRLLLSHEPLTSISWAFNIHGHVHDRKKCKVDSLHLNACLDATNYELVNVNQFMKSGKLAKIDSIHRETIDRATARKKRR